MVKEIAVIVAISECTVMEFYSVVFDNKDTLQEYHRLEGDPDASISPWSGDTRVIAFSVPLTGVPDVVKRAIGASTLTIRETQQKRWSEDGSLTVTSEPILDFVGGSKFATSAEFTVQAEGTGCKVTAVVTCEAAGPWGLITTIEGIMATQAEKSVSGFLAFCTARCKGEPLPEYARSDAEYMDEFLDAAETLSMASSGELGGILFILLFCTIGVLAFCAQRCKGNSLLECAASEAEYMGERLDAAETLSMASSGDLSGWENKQQLQPLLKRIEDNTSALERTLSSLRFLEQKSQGSPSKAPLTKQTTDASLSTGGLWLPLLIAFVLGCCFGAAFQSWPRTRLSFRKA